MNWRLFRKHWQMSPIIFAFKVRAFFTVTLHLSVYIVMVHLHLLQCFFFLEAPKYNHYTGFYNLICYLVNLKSPLLPILHHSNLKCWSIWRNLTLLGETFCLQVCCLGCQPQTLYESVRLAYSLSLGVCVNTIYQKRSVIGFRSQG